MGADAKIVVAMNSTAHADVVAFPAIERYFDVSLFLLVVTGLVAVISTGKLDPISTALPLIALPRGDRGE